MILNRPLIAITMGDPAGIGPEIVIKTLSRESIFDVCKPVVIGDSKVLKNAMTFTNKQLELNELSNLNNGQFTVGTVDVINLDNVDMNKLKLGEVQRESGKCAFEYVEYAVKLAQEGNVDALATAPINKESLEKAKVPFIGHTEMLAHYTGVNDPLTMFEVQALRIFFLTRHVSLRKMLDMITSERIYDYLVRSHNALEKLGVDSPRLAVAGLNPHSGERGLFGKEEIEEIEPGIERARAKGINAYGPVPADSVFYQALNEKYDAVLSLYHDQGHIAAKMTDFELTTSITNDLPFLRTSVDHGTAFDIAGKGIASSVSMEECIKLAAKYTVDFQNNRNNAE